jgi:hypothetical protein
MSTMGKRREQSLRVSSYSLVTIFTVAAIAMAIILAVLLGRGVSARSHGGDIRIDPKYESTTPPVAETFGRGSPIAAERGEAEAHITEHANQDAASTQKVAFRSSSAKFITQGDASPIAVGPGARANATMDAR